jgi:hypothetical protein
MSSGNAPDRSRTSPGRVCRVPVSSQRSENHSFRSSRKGTCIAVAEHQQVLVFEGGVGVRGEHPAAHELRRRVRRLAPDDVGEGGEPVFAQSAGHLDVVRVLLERPTDGSGRVTHVDDRDAAGREHARDLRPGPVEQGVHPVERPVPLARLERVRDRGVLRRERVVPHLHHRVRRGRDDELDRVVGERQVAGVPDVDLVGGLHALGISRVG